jgi:hypothetical protein
LHISSHAHVHSAHHGCVFGRVAPRTPTCTPTCTWCPHSLPSAAFPVAPDERTRRCELNIDGASQRKAAAKGDDTR